MCATYRDPVAKLAELRGYESVETVRQLVLKIRKDGFLGPAPRGRAGGDPTPKAYDALRED